MRIKVNKTAKNKNIYANKLLFLFVVLFYSFNALAQHNLSGTVKDQNGQPLPGANVIEKNTKNGEQTDFDGNFSINLTDQNAILVVSYLGFKTSEVTVNSQSQLNIILQEDAASLDEVVVIGYGTVKKSDLTGSVVSLSSKDITKVVSSSFDTAIQGRLPGVEINSSSGQPGAESSIKIRGGTSISGGNQPLIVIDGVPISDQSSSDGTLESAGVNPLSSINPNDIASIDILKDASAAAIYGARAGNGVVIITTKRGLEGKPQISLNLFTGAQQVISRYDLINATQYAEQLNRTSNDVVFTDEQINSFGEGTDWQDAIFRTATTRNAGINVRGGTAKSKYSMSLDYFDQEGTIIYTGLDRISVRANLDTELGNFEFGSRLSYSLSDSNVVISGQDPNAGNNGSSPVQTVVFMDPLTPIYDEDGNPNTVSGNPNNDNDITNPIAVLRDGVGRSKSGRFISNIFGVYNFSDNLSFKTSLGFDVLNRKEDYYRPQSAAANEGGIARVGSREATTWLNENVLTYNNNFSEGNNINIILGQAIQSNTSTFFQAAGQDFPSDDTDVNNLGAAGQISSISSSINEWSIASFFGRINYTLNDKYLFTLNGRYDGSSRFGDNNKWAFFPSGAFAWKMHEENFLKDSKSISQLKLRLSYGITGNQDIPTYRSLSSLDTQQLNSNGILNTTFYSSRVANPDLKWETTSQFNFGLDLGLFKSRVNLTADYYVKTTKDLLLDRALPNSTGFRSSLQNIGSIENKGIEIGLNSVNVSNKDFSWTSNFNISSNTNQVLDIGLEDPDGFINIGLENNITKSQPAILKVGEPVGTFFGLIFDGIYNEDQGTGSTQPTSLAGDPIFRDVNEDGVINTEDREIIGSALPDFIYGITNNFSYKNLDLSIFFQGVYGNDIYNNTKLRLTGDFPRLVEYYENAWTPTNQNNTYPAVDQTGVVGWTSDLHSAFIEDGSYLRLKNITLGYNFDDKILSKLPFTAIRLYVAADNVFTITNYSGLNPDVSSRPNDNFNLGYDDFIYPAAKNYRLGVNLTF